MGSFNVHVAVNKKQTLLFATIKNEKNEILKEIIEFIGSMGAKFHQKLLNRRCIDWIKFEYEEPAAFIPTSVDTSGASTLTEDISGGFTTTESISGASNI